MEKSFRSNAVTSTTYKELCFSVWMRFLPRGDLCSCEDTHALVYIILKIHIFSFEMNMEFKSLKARIGFPRFTALSRSNENLRLFKKWNKAIILKIKRLARKKKLTHIEICNEGIYFLAFWSMIYFERTYLILYTWKTFSWIEVILSRKESKKCRWLAESLERWKTTPLLFK